MSSQVQGSPQGIVYNKWFQLVVGVICMMMIANLQYGWTLFVVPISNKFGFDKAALQIAFSIFVFVETWIVPIEAWFVDKYGPKPVIIFGGITIAISWVWNAYAGSLFAFYASAVVAAFGAGAVYGTAVGNALKWFPTQRGLAAGFTASGFGAGAAFTVVPISNMINSSGYESAFLYFGIGQGVIVVLAALFIKKAPPAPKGIVTMKTQAGRDYTPKEVLRSPVFWVLYPMFVMVATGGLMAAAQIGPIAKDYGIDKTPVTILGFTLPCLTMAIALDRIFDGFGRPFFGWVADNIGRENTMFLAFSFCAVFMFILSKFARDPIVFCFVTAFYFGCYGEIFSLFPSTQGDTFGSGYAATNAGMLYTAKGTAGLLVPLGSVIASSFGWSAVFFLSMALCIVAALMAIFVLKPIRARHLANSRLPVAAPTH